MHLTITSIKNVYIEIPITFSANFNFIKDVMIEKKIKTMYKKYGGNEFLNKT